MMQTSYRGALYLDNHACAHIFAALYTPEVEDGFAIYYGHSIAPNTSDFDTVSNGCELGFRTLVTRQRGAYLAGENANADGAMALLE